MTSQSTPSRAPTRPDPEPARRSRRSVLATAVAASVGTFAAAAATAIPVRATNDDPVLVGHIYSGTSPTGVATGSSGVTALAGTSNSGIGVSGVTVTGKGLSAISLGDGYGVFAQSVAGPAVFASNSGGIGLWAESTGPYDISNDTWAIRAESDNNGGILGLSSRIGVKGASSNLAGVYGQGDAGPGVYATNIGTGLALQVDGRVKLNRSGRVSIASGKKYLDITVPGGVSTSALCFAHLAVARSGTYVTAVRPGYPSSTKIRVYLNRAVTAATPISWLVLS